MTLDFWLEQKLPYAWSYYPRNRTELYCGTDQICNIDPNWTFPVTYIMNSHGFRTHEFEDIKNEQINISLGCSHTMGIGLPIEMTWPSLIEKETKIKTLNLGLGGASTDTVARFLTNISGLFDVNSVYILWPPFNRFEEYHNDRIVEILPHCAKLEHAWYMDESNSYQRFYKNQKIVDILKKLHNFDLHQLQYDTTDWHVPGDLARDQIHSGPKSHLNLANMFLTMNE
jgi:hypothetical protein